MIIILVVAVVAVTVVWLVKASRRAGAVPQRGAHTLRRFLQHGMLAAAAITSSIGMARLLAAALPEDVLAGRRAADIALGLALTLVAAPAWAVLWRYLSARLADDADERAAPAWTLYLFGITTAALIVAFVQWVTVARWLLGLEAYTPDPLAGALVWTAVWSGHAWLLSRPRYRPPDVMASLPMLSGSAVGLAGVLTGGVSVLATGSRELYELIVDAPLVKVPLTETLGVGLVVLALGGVVWWWHWWRHALRAPGTGPWLAHVLLVGVLGGLMMSVVATGLSLHAALQWWFGEPHSATAAAHFQLLPDTLATLVLGIAAWWYHRSVLQGRGATSRREPERIYDHLVSAVGLVAAAAGVTTGIVALIQALTPGAFAAIDPSGRNTLTVAVTLVIVGLPLWLTPWRRVQSIAALGAREELTSSTRRSYLILLLGFGSLVAAISLVVILFVVTRDLLEGRLEVDVVSDLRVAVGLIVTAGAVAAYHTIVYRRDRAVIAAVDQPTHPRDVLLVTPDGRTLAQAVAAATGAKVRGLHRLDAAAVAVDAQRIAGAVLTSGHDHVIVTVDERGRIDVIPYDRG